MEIKKYNSPREEAFELAYQTRKDILEGKRDVISILRYCLVIAKTLNKKEEEEWVSLELFGYPISKVPPYRKIGCTYEEDDKPHRDLRDFDINVEVHLLDSKLRQEKDLRLVIEDNLIAILDRTKMERILSAIIDKCLLFINDTISELQYGGIIQYIIEDIRNDVDSKLLQLDPKISDEINSLYINLASNNPSDWPKVADSCRRILMFLADILFPPQDELYQMKDGRKVEIKSSHVINRLCAFIDMKLKGDERKFITAELNYLESYLRQIVEFTQMGVHNKKGISKFDASMIATHTYLVISDLIIDREVKNETENQAS